MGCHSLLQGVFLSQGSNPCLLHCRQILYQLRHRGSPCAKDGAKYFMYIKPLTITTTIWGRYYYHHHFIEDLIKLLKAMQVVSGRAGWSWSPYHAPRLLLSEKAMAPHSITLAWTIPWTDEPGRLQSMGSLRVRHDWATSLSLSFHALEKEMATRSSVLAWRIPGTREPGGLPSMGSHRVGHDWSDLAAAAAAGCFSNINIMQELSVSSEGRHPGFECCLPNCDLDKKNHTF